MNDPVDQAARRVARLERDRNHSTSSRRDFLSAYDFVWAPVTSLHQHFGNQGCNQGTRGGIIEENDIIDSVKGSQNFGALLLEDQGPARSFVLADARVRIDAYDQHVAERARLFEEPDMAGMKKIETPVREDNALAIAFPVTDVENQLVLRNHSTQCTRPQPPRSFKFYHARRSRR